MAGTQSSWSPLDRAFDEIEAIVPPQNLNDMATILLRLIGQLTPTEFMEIRSIVLAMCALEEAQRPSAQLPR